MRYSGAARGGTQETSTLWHRVNTYWYLESNKLTPDTVQLVSRSSDEWRYTFFLLFSPWGRRTKGSAGSCGGSGWFLPPAVKKHNGRVGASTPPTVPKNDPGMSQLSTGGWCQRHAYQHGVVMPDDGATGARATMPRRRRRRQPPMKKGAESTQEKNKRTKNRLRESGQRYRGGLASAETRERRGPEEQQDCTADKTQ